MKEFFCRKRILITGGFGYLASNVIRHLKDTDCQIIRLGRRLSNSYPENGCVHVENRKGDVRDIDVWDSLLEGIDIIFHFAAQTSVYTANAEPSSDLEVNVLPMLRLLETCKKKKTKPTILFSGTATEAGIPGSLPVDETQPDRPLTIYDLHKLVSENYLKHYVRGGIVRGAVLRLANVYGPGPKSSSADRGVLNQMVRKALNGEPLTIYGKGDYLRDYIYVGDVARAFLHAASAIERIDGEHFVIGSGKGYTIAEAINMVADRVGIKTGNRVPVVHVETPSTLSPIEFRNFVANSRKFSALTGWKANVDLAVGIDYTIESLLKNEEARTESISRQKHG